MAGVAMTGGTAAPTVAMRQAATQRAIKGPRVAAQRAQPRSRAPLSAKPAQHQAAGKGLKVINTPGPASAKGGGVAFNPIAGMLNTQQLGQLANQITRQNMQTQLAPLRQQAGEIRNTEGTVAKRYGGYSEATDKLLQGVGQQAEASAKTYENQAADAALKAGQAINQVGSSAAAQNAGYIDPQVQAELDAEGKLAAGTGGAQSSFAQAAGQNEQGFMANLRAASAQRALEGQRGIQTTYGGELTKNQAQQQQLIGKQPAEAKSLAVELGQKQFTDNATLQGLGIKQAGVQQNAQKIEVSAQQNKEHDRLSERGQNITVSQNAAKDRLEERKIAETERHNRESEATAAEKARAEVKKAMGGLTTSQQDKVSGEIGTAYNVIQQLRSGASKRSPQEIRDALTAGKRRTQIEAETSDGKKYWKSSEVKYPKIGNQALISAAMELWNYHKVSPQIAQALKGIGLPVPSNWTNGTFTGF